jgi:hypothetical protein
MIQCPRVSGMVLGWLLGVSWVLGVVTGIGCVIRGIRVCNTEFYVYALESIIRTHLTLEFTPIHSNSKCDVAVWECSMDVLRVPDPVPTVLLVITGLSDGNLTFTL